MRMAFRTTKGYVAVIGLLLVLHCQLVHTSGESRFLLQRSARGIDPGMVGSDLVSDGLLVNSANIYSVLTLNQSGYAVKESGTCEETYGFLPCTTSAVGNLFLLLVYGYLMFQAAAMLSNGSELLLAVMGPGIIGGLFLPVLGAFPDALLILVSGISGSKETAQRQVLIGMGLLAGSTVMLLTALWGSCLAVGKCDLSESTAIDSHDTKGFSLFVFNRPRLGYIILFFFYFYLDIYKNVKSFEPIICYTDLRASSIVEFGFIHPFPARAALNYVAVFLLL